MNISTEVQKTKTYELEIMTLKIANELEPLISYYCKKKLTNSQAQSAGSTSCVPRQTTTPQLKVKG